MAISDKIMQKINELDVEDIRLQKLLLKILEEEDQGIPHYKEKYGDIIENFLEENHKEKEGGE